MVEALVHAMRLLDLIIQESAQSMEASMGLYRTSRMYADAVRGCPLRLVLADDMTRCCTSLGFSDGDRLSGCLDLVRAPSEQLWVEWSETPRQVALGDILGTSIRPTVKGGRAGLLVSSAADGRSGTIRGFWSTPDAEVGCAALTVEYDLSRPIRRANGIADIFRGETASVTMLHDSAIDAVLSHVTFRFDAPSLEYYRGRNLSADQQSAVLRTALGALAFSIPSLFALFLLLGARDAVRQCVVYVQRLNRARRLLGRADLLDHIEVSTCTGAAYKRYDTVGDVRVGSGRRLHHVRGHLARRGNMIYWRAPHLRGNALLGVVQSRTVQLSFH